MLFIIVWPIRLIFIVNSPAFFEP